MKSNLARAARTASYSFFSMPPLTYVAARRAPLLPRRFSLNNNANSGTSDDRLAYGSGYNIGHNDGSSSSDVGTNNEDLWNTDPRLESKHFAVPESEQRFGAGNAEAGIGDGSTAFWSSPPSSEWHQSKAIAPLVPECEESGMQHPVWSASAVKGVQITHVPPTGIIDGLAWTAVRSLRFSFDVASGYAFGKMDERAWLNRVVFLETVAGVPGLVGAAIRHLRSLRRMERDHGWIHTLLEEAENERMHLMTALALRRPGIPFRLAVLLTQGFFLMAFSSSYLLSRRFAHRFVGYLEEEAVKTYSHLLEEMDAGKLPLFASLPAPMLARRYWQLDDNAMFRDVVLAIRADEAHHRQVNHTFADMHVDEPNPFPPGQ